MLISISLVPAGGNEGKLKGMPEFPRLFGRLSK